MNWEVVLGIASVVVGIVGVVATYYFSRKLFLGKKEANIEVHLTQNDSSSPNVRQNKNNFAPSELEQYMEELDKGLLLDQWQLLSMEPGILRTNEFYALKNLITQKSIEHGFVKKGIQLVWGADSLQHVIAFEKPGTEERSNLRFGDKVAIRMKDLDRGFIICKGRGYGINLAWSTDPNYQWIIGSKKMEDRDLSVGDEFSLFNTIISEYVVHFPRSNGVSLRWHTDCQIDWKFEAPNWKKGKPSTSI